MVDQCEIEVFREAFLRAGGPIGASDDAIRAGIEAVDQLHARNSEPCRAEVWSWDRFRPEQVDGYWVRCTLLGQHDRHEDAHTGLKWADQVSTDTGSSASSGRQP